MLPAVTKLDKITFHPAVTFLVGENGAGKSTLLEAIAVAWGFNPEGGSHNFRFSTRASHSSLSDHLRWLSRLRRSSAPGAESSGHPQTAPRRSPPAPRHSPPPPAGCRRHSRTRCAGPGHRCACSSVRPPYRRHTPRGCRRHRPGRSGGEAYRIELVVGITRAAAIRVTYITQVQLAETLGVSQQTINAYETGSRHIPVSALLTPNRLKRY